MVRSTVDARRPVARCRPGSGRRRRPPSRAHTARDGGRGPAAGGRARAGLPVRGRGARGRPADVVAALLATRYGLTAPGLAGRVHTATAGWPALVHLAAAALARGGGDDSAQPAAL